MHLLQAPQRVEVEMIVMIVADQHDVDVWQVGERNAGGMHPAGTCPLHWADAIRVHRVGQHVHARKLQQERYVVDEGDRKLASRQSLWQSRLRSVLDPLRPRRGTARALPAHEVAEGSAGRSRRVLVTEHAAIEMVGRRAPVAGTTRNRTSRRISTRCEFNQLPQWLAHARVTAAQGCSARYRNGRLVSMR
jgi:hypothetical protein